MERRTDHINNSSEYEHQEKSRKSNAFYEDVYEVVKLIPPGRVTSYGAIAAYLGAKRSARLVGYAMNKSLGYPEIPAHRVVNRNGLLTGRHHFPEDRPMDKALENEGIEVKNGQVVHFEKHFWDPMIELAL